LETRARFRLISHWKRLALAGLWEPWQAPDGGEIDSCTILTRDAIPSMREIHDRMPVILFPEQYDAWLYPQMRDGMAALAPLKPTPDGAVYATAVSRYLGNSRHEGLACIASPESA
jgi:putative SOS response-associated peptidase YedK